MESDGCSLGGGVAAVAPLGEGGQYKNKQLVQRLPVEFVRRVLTDFNSGSLDAATDASHLGGSRSRLYELRTALLRERGEGRMRPTPPAALLDLRLSLRCSRRVNHNHTTDFDGHNYEIAPTLRTTVTPIHQRTFGPPP